MFSKTKTLRYALPALALAAFGVQGAAAQSSGFYLNGYAQVGSFISGSGIVYGLTELNFGYDAASAGGGNWGVDIDAFQYVDEGDSFGAIAASLYYDASFGRITVGMPSSPIGDYVTAPEFGRSAIMALEGSIIFGGIVDYIRWDESIGVYGVRFDGTAGNIGYGISVNGISESPDVLVDAAMSYTSGIYTISAGVETVEGDFGYVGAVAADFGKVDMLLAVSNPIFGPSDIFYDVEITYAATDSFDLTAGYVGEASGGGFDMAYVAAYYTFLENGYVGATALDVFDSDPAYDIALGWNFNIGG